MVTPPPSPRVRIDHARCLARSARSRRTMPRCSIITPRTLPPCLARTLPPCLDALMMRAPCSHLASMPRDWVSTMPRTDAIERASRLAGIARRGEARCLATLARLANQITLLAVGVFRSRRYPNLGPLPEGGGGGPTDRKFL